MDLIVPTIRGREASLERCLTSFERLTDADLTVIVVRDSETCGQGWIEGLERSTAPYVALVADDLECTSSMWAQVCVETVDEGLLPCPRVWRPDSGIESQGGDMNALGHLISRYQKDSTPVDFTTVPFMSREQVENIGMIPTQYGCDVWVSYRGRQLGYETVLRHGWDLIHYQEQVGRGAGMDQNERDALDTQTMLTELAYGSHTPTLRRVLEEERPRRVLEIGAGRYSTGQFLRSGVEQLDSVETDREWREKVRSLYPDQRLQFRTEIPAKLDYDFVFIDGPDTEAGRLESIREVLSREHPTTVIHDAEHQPYRELIEDFTNGNVEYCGEERQTAVIR